MGLFLVFIDLLRLRPLIGGVVLVVAGFLLMATNVGYEGPPDRVSCSNCGSPNDPDAAECGYCGSAL